MNTRSSKNLAQKKRIRRKRVLRPATSPGSAPPPTGSARSPPRAPSSSRRPGGSSPTPRPSTAKPTTTCVPSCSSPRRLSQRPGPPHGYLSPRGAVRQRRRAGRPDARRGRVLRGRRRGDRVRGHELERRGLSRHVRILNLGT